MSLIIKIVAILAGVLLILGSICVTIAAIFPPKEFKGDGNERKSDTWDESIEDI